MVTRGKWHHESLVEQAASLLIVDDTIKHEMVAKLQTQCWGFL